MNILNKKLKLINKKLKLIKLGLDISIDLINIKNAYGIGKGRGKPVGSISHRSDGDYIKEPDGTWTKVVQDEGNKNTEDSGSDLGNGRIVNRGVFNQATEEDLDYIRENGLPVGVYLHGSKDTTLDGKALELGHSDTGDIYTTPDLNVALGYADGASEGVYLIHVNSDKILDFGNPPDEFIDKILNNPYRYDTIKDNPFLSDEILDSEPGSEMYDELKEFVVNMFNVSDFDESPIQSYDDFLRTAQSLGYAAIKDAVGQAVVIFDEEAL